MTNTTDLNELYRDGVGYLDDNFAYFLTHVLNIGRPEWNMGVPTACVGLPVPPKGGKVKNFDDYKFMFNPEFAKLFPIEGFAFIMAHETMHIVLNHLKLSQRFKNKMMFNIAADAVINDYLESMGFEIPMIPDAKEGEGLIQGEAVVGYNCAHATVGEVYADLKKEARDNGAGEGDGEGEGAPTEGYGDGKGQFKQIDGHDWMHKATEDQQEAAENAGQANPLPKDLDDTKQDDDRKAGYKLAGNGVGSKQAFIENKDIGLKWAELMEKVNPMAFKNGPRPRPGWHRRPRKLASFPNVILPVVQEGVKNKGGNQPSIVMALDTSGSIGQEDANRFVNFARSVPQDKIKLFACTFTTQYQELDLENPSWNTGGTSFEAINEYIDNEVKGEIKDKYPTAVVVITDGYASFANTPGGKEADAWYWLITEGGTKGGDYGTTFPGTVDDLVKYVK